MGLGVQPQQEHFTMYSLIFVFGNNISSSKTDTKLLPTL